jgi:pimeloyl-ACP methyl ester carboxylesterase
MSPALPLLIAISSLVSTAPDGAKTVPAPDGVPIAYEERGTAKPGVATLVLIHGWCCDRTQFAHQMESMSKTRRVVALDLPGHGESGHDRATWTIAGYGADVKAVCEKLGLDRVILAGHSMGGTVSLEAARLMPGRVIGVIGIDTLQNAEFEFPKEMIPQLVAAFDANFEGTMRQWIPNMLPPGTDPAIGESIVKRAMRCDKKSVLAVFTDFTNVDSKAMFAAAKVPIRCVNAAPATPQSMPTAIEINKKYADFDATLMEGVGHYPMIEKPAAFDEKLAWAIAEIEKKAAAATAPRR